MGGHSESGHLQAKKRALSRNHPGGTLMLDLQLLGLWGNTLVLLKLHRVWHSVTVA